MKNTNRRFTGKIAAMLAAAMMMTMTAAISASADNTGNEQVGTARVFTAYDVAHANVTIRGNGKVSGEIGSNTKNPDITVSGNYSSVHLVSGSLNDKIYLKAAANEGWTFVRWVNAKTGKTYSKKNNLTIKGGESVDLIAEFKAAAVAKPEAVPETKPEAQPETEPKKGAETPAQKITWIIDLFDINEIIKVLPKDIF